MSPPSFTTDEDIIELYAKLGYTLPKGVNFPADEAVEFDSEEYYKHICYSNKKHYTPPPIQDSAAAEEGNKIRKDLIEKIRYWAVHPNEKQSKSSTDSHHYYRGKYFFMLPEEFIDAMRLSGPAQALDPWGCFYRLYFMRYNGKAYNSNCVICKLCSKVHSGTNASNPRRHIVEKHIGWDIKLGLQDRKLIMSYIQCIHQKRRQIIRKKNEHNAKIQKNKLFALQKKKKIYCTICIRERASYN